tara:strand:+ start:24 stop:197 length:174 start_codon:yes stop_codon:yes gene_type:complete
MPRVGIKISLMDARCLLLAMGVTYPTDKEREKTQQKTIDELVRKISAAHKTLEKYNL